MAHLQQIEFCTLTKNKFPQFFTNTNVLDCGSLDINGNNRYLFNGCNYYGIDIGQGKNVDFVSPIHLFKPEKKYKTIISTECFEHDKYYKDSILNIYELLESGGMFIFTCATTGRPEHGTLRTQPQDSPFTSVTKGWSDYYKNLTEEDFREFFDFDENFKEYEFSVNNNSKDIYFWGLKK